MRPRRHVKSVDHPAWALRFDPGEWPGEPLEAFVAWRSAFDNHWREQKAAGRVVLPVAAHGCFTDGHLGWRFKTKSEARQVARLA